MRSKHVHGHRLQIKIFHVCINVKVLATLHFSIAIQHMPLLKHIYEVPVIIVSSWLWFRRSWRIVGCKQSINE